MTLVMSFILSLAIFCATKGGISGRERPGGCPSHDVEAWAVTEYSVDAHQTFRIVYNIKACTEYEGLGGGARTLASAPNIRIFVTDDDDRQTDTVTSYCVSPEPLLGKATEVAKIWKIRDSGLTREGLRHLRVPPMSRKTPY